jgi:hypothetical protein
MKTPPHVVVHRLVAAVITVLILLVIGLGVASHGPLGGLGAGTGRADQLIHTLAAKGWLG